MKRIVYILFIVVSAIIGVIIGGSVSDTSSFFNAETPNNPILGKATVIGVEFHENGYKLTLESCVTPSDCSVWAVVVTEPLPIGQEILVEISIQEKSNEHNLN